MGLFSVLHQVLARASWALVYKVETRSVACRPRFPYMEPLHVRNDLFWAYESVLGGYRNPDISLRRLKNLVAVAFR